MIQYFTSYWELGFTVLTLAIYANSFRKMLAYQKADPISVALSNPKLYRRMKQFMIDVGLASRPMYFMIALVFYTAVLLFTVLVLDWLVYSTITAILVLGDFYVTRNTFNRLMRA